MVITTGRMKIYLNDGRQFVAQYTNFRRPADMFVALAQALVDLGMSQEKVEAELRSLPQKLELEDHSEKP